MDIKLKVNIDDSRISDGLLAAMNTINQINECADNDITLDFSDVRFVTPLYVLPLVVFLNGCDKNIVCNESRSFYFTKVSTIR